METGSIAQLLSQTKSIVEKYDKIPAATGERFNIFEITGLETDEVKLHSAFIAELLNPRGTHGLKDRFLQLFLEMLSKQKREFANQETLSEQKLCNELDDARVSVEKYIVPLEENDYTGGRIDILIEFNDGQKIAIENKIYAVDQKHQLRRYANYSKDIDLIYLTLDGKEADNFTTCNTKFPNEKITPLLFSYKTDIISWLQNCLKESASRPLVRETIIQYIYLLKKLTNQNNNDAMNIEMVNTIVNNNFIVEAETIYKAWDEIKTKIVENLIENLKKEYANSDWEMSLEANNKAIGKAGTGFRFSKTDWDYCIYFYFENGDNLWFGIDYKNLKLTEDKQNELREKLKDFPTASKPLTSDGWIWGTNFKEYNELEWSDVSTEAPLLINRVLIGIAQTIE